MKLLRRGGFIAGSNGVRTWISFKYERLPMSCHYCVMLGHDVKHYASYFAVIKNGGKVDYQYGDFLRALGGRPRYSPSRNVGPSAKWEQSLRDYQNEISSLMGR